MPGAMPMRPRPKPEPHERFVYPPPDFHVDVARHRLQTRLPAQDERKSVPHTRQRRMRSSSDFSGSYSKSDLSLIRSMREHVVNGRAGFKWSIGPPPYRGRLPPRSTAAGFPVSRDRRRPDGVKLELDPLGPI